jgi:hypothetical protein
MSLNFRLKNVANYETLCYHGERMNPVTEALIFHCLALGMSEISEKNASEFFLRSEFHRKLFGAPLKRLAHQKGEHDTEVPFTMDDIQAHIGLTTNVHQEPRKAWCKRITEYWMREEEYRAQRRKREMQPA